MLDNKFIMLMMLLCLISISAVNAADNATSEISGVDVEENVILEDSNEEILSNSDGELISDETNDNSVGSFKDLSELIKDNDNGTIVLDRDYKYSSHDSDYYGGIQIDRDIIICGDNHCINGSDTSGLFKVVINRTVTFKDIVFANGKQNFVRSAAGAILIGLDVKNVTVINCTFINNYAWYGGAMLRGTAINCTFINNRADQHGGAIHDVYAVNCIFRDNSAGWYGGAMEGGTAINCTFDNNYSNHGGAMDQGITINCTFINNRADENGGAVCRGSVINCTFTNNHSPSGGAMVGGTAIKCTFINNRADENGGAVCDGFAIQCNFTNNTSSKGEAMYGSNATLCIFVNNTCEDTEFVSLNFAVSNFTSIYDSGEKLFFNLTYGDENFIGFNTTIDIYKNDKLIATNYCLSGEGWVVNLNPGYYKAVLSIDKSEEVNKATIFLKIKLPTIITANNLSTNYGSGEDFVITLKDDRNNAVSGADVTVDFCGVKKYRTDKNGQIKISTKDLPVNMYVADVYLDGEGIYTESSATALIIINKETTKIASEAVKTTYNSNKNLVITLMDHQGKVLKGFKVAVNLNGLKTYTTDKNGQIKIAVGNLVPKTYNVNMNFAGDANYIGSSASVKVAVNKASPKLTVKAKSRMCKITLKSNSKAIKNAKVTLKIKGKTLSAKTNSKGQATVKLSKFKGKFNVVVKYGGNKYYNKVIKKAKITVK